MVSVLGAAAASAFCSTVPCGATLGSPPPRSALGCSAGGASSSSTFSGSVWAMAKHGHPTREYVVFGAEWWLYVCNRLAEQPERLYQAIVEPMREEGLAESGFATAEELRRDVEAFETWSRFLLEGSALA